MMMKKKLSTQALFTHAIFLSAIMAASVSSQEQQECQTVVPLPDSEFDINSWIDGKWYSHQQRESPYQTEEFFYCGTAEYRYLNPALGGQDAAGIANGFDIKVFNYGEDVDGNVVTSDDTIGVDGVTPLPGHLCAGQSSFPGDLESQLSVLFCTFPVTLAQESNYWILAYDEEEGSALIAGGQTDIPTTTDGLCSYANPRAGLWIFSRSPFRDETMIEKYRGIARDNGIDPSIMKDVSHVGCSHTTTDAPVTSFPIVAPITTITPTTTSPTIAPTIAPPTTSKQSKKKGKKKSSSDESYFG